MQNLEIYKDTKRNAKCPCGSGKIFKRCCMKEYREAKKKGSGKKIKMSTFSPIKPLEEDDAKEFMKFYDRVLLFSYHRRSNSKMIVTDDLIQLLTHERDYFYENREAVLEEFIKENSLNDRENALVDSIRDTRYDTFVLLEYDEKRAIVSDTRGHTYNVQTLTTPFTELFKTKPLFLRTAMVPYCNRYILDGRYSIVQEKMSKAIHKEIEKIPTLGLETHYQKEGTIEIFPVTINLTLFCDAVHYEKMEDIVLRQIPDDFTQKMVDKFKDTPFERVSFCSSFIRSMDLLNDINGDELKEARLFNGLSISNYEMNGDSTIISYNILEAYYKQKSLNRSISKSVYETVQKAKEIVKRGERNKFQASSFYSMLGVFYIHSHNIDEFEFLKELYTKEARELFTQEIENLFDTINSNLDFEITPVFLDFALDLDEIIDEIDEFREYMEGLLFKNLNNIKKYSISKGKKPNIFEKIDKR
jgi:hypothetical protein